MRFALPLKSVWLAAVLAVLSRFAWQHFRVLFSANKSIGTPATLDPPPPIEPHRPFTPADVLQALDDLVSEDILPGTILYNFTRIEEDLLTHSKDPKMEYQSCQILE